MGDKDSFLSEGGFSKQDSIYSAMNRSEQSSMLSSFTSSSANQSVIEFKDIEEINTEITNAQQESGEPDIEEIDVIVEVSAE